MYFMEEENYVFSFKSTFLKEKYVPSKILQNVLESDLYTSLFINFHNLFNKHSFFHSFNMYLFSTYQVLC